MTGQVTMRWYDHKAYTVVVDGAETAAFAIAIYRGWELRLRPAGPLDPGPDFCRVFATLGAVRDWLRTGEGRAWLDQIRQMPPVKTRPIPTGWRGTDRHGRHQCLGCWGWRHPANHSCPGVPQAGCVPPPTPRRIQRSRQRGWRMPPDAVYVGRPTKWGNPFEVRPLRDGRWQVIDINDRSAGLREEPQIMPDRWAAAVFAVRFYQLHTGPLGLYEWDDVGKVRHQLAGRDLACWCPLVDADGEPWPCHADALLQLANP